MPYLVNCFGGAIWAEQVWGELLDLGIPKKPGIDHLESFTPFICTWHRRSGAGAGQKARILLIADCTGAVYLLGPIIYCQVCTVMHRQ
jgi:hypothetical protein